MIEPLPVNFPVLICPKCRLRVDEADAFCRHCGRRLREGNRWWHEPIWIAVLAFGVMGPFAIPLVMRSPKMTRNAKIAMIASILAYTFVLVYMTYAIISMVWRQYSEILNSY